VIRRRRTRRALTLAAGLVILPAAARAADAPAWLQQASALPASALERNADAVVLQDDVQVTVSDDGRITRRRTYAVRVLTKAGAGAAAVREIYSTNGGDVRTMRGWLLVDGRVSELGRGQTADLSLAANDVYNESRLRVLRADIPLAGGVVFGAETEVSERTVFTQLQWELQDEWPVLQLRRSLTLPPGGEVRSVTFNHAPLEPARTGQTFTWVLRDLQPVVSEPSAPPASAVVPRIAVTYTSPRAPSVFESWETVSGWLATLADPQAELSPALTSKARELTAGATTELARIAAIGRYVQQVQYISIQTGLERGGGYTPHRAADVLSKNYGDCKDKANLMRALLAAVGVKAHLVAIYSGDPDYVRSEWPSPQQFNHAIAAILLSDAESLPASTGHPSLGRVLYFDPTDEQTPVGELPLHLQGSQGLLILPRAGGLVRMPLSAPEANPSLRQVEATVDLRGTLRATIHQVTAGDPASFERYLYRSLTRDEYARKLEADVQRQVTGARLTLGQVGNDPSGNRFEVIMNLEAPGYAQTIQNRLLLLRPPELPRPGLPELTPGARQHAILLDPREERDTFQLTLPSGVTVDELPEARAMETPFGRFSVTWRASGTTVSRTLTLRLTRTTLPASANGQVLAFMDAFRQAERQPVVLAR
jgi:transglutaminase superfamily protein/uncharacterized protein DUF3857